MVELASLRYSCDDVFSVSSGPFDLYVGFWVKDHDVPAVVLCDSEVVEEC